MGKDWLYWGGGGGRSTKRGRIRVERETPSGCMSAVFHLFDFHQFQFALHQPVPAFKPDSFHPEEPTILKGVEAPRNSLEIEQPLNVPVGIQIKTSRSKLGAPKARLDQDLSSEYSSSPGSKTPNLVARLMGLDLLPDTCSPSLKQRNPSRSGSTPITLFDTDIIGTRSLPETPRISSARRSDVDHHRLSLQINKENSGTTKDMELSSSSPGQYARQLVKQVRESVGRRVGLDITNTVRNREQRRDDHLVLLRPKKQPSSSTSPSKESTTTPSCSPRLRFLESKNKPVDAPHKSSKAASQEEEDHKQNLNQKPKKIASGTDRPRLKKPSRTSDVLRNKQEEAFVRSAATSRGNMAEKKCKRTPLSSELLNVSVPTLFPIKKEPPSPATRLLPQKQLSDAISSKRSAQFLPSGSSRLYGQKVTHMPAIRDNCSSSSVTTGDVGTTEFQYVTGILKRFEIDQNNPVSYAKWYSLAQPLDPSVFHLLELSFPTPTAKNSQLGHRCNRWLIFQLVDELLVEILRPYINLKPWVCSFGYNHPIYGSELIDKICGKIGSFPSADCRVLEDIDALIEDDLRKLQLGRRMAMEEEGEAIVGELERDLVDSLVHEMAVMGNRV